jgi:hypothetical protein
VLLATRVEELLLHNLIGLEYGPQCCNLESGPVLAAVGAGTDTGTETGAVAVAAAATLGATLEADTLLLCPGQVACTT